MEEEIKPPKAVRREQRRRNARKMRVSGKMTATVNAMRKAAAAATRKRSPKEHRTE